MWPFVFYLLINLAYITYRFKLNLYPSAGPGQIDGRDGRCRRKNNNNNYMRSRTSHTSFVWCSSLIHSCVLAKRLSYRVFSSRLLNFYFSYLFCYSFILWIPFLQEKSACIHKCCCRAKHSLFRRWNAIRYTANYNTYQANKIKSLIDVEFHVSYGESERDESMQGAEQRRNKGHKITQKAVKERKKEKNEWIVEEMKEAKQSRRSKAGTIHIDIITDHTTQHKIRINQSLTHIISMRYKIHIIFVIQLIPVRFGSLTHTHTRTRCPKRSSRGGDEEANKIEETEKWSTMRIETIVEGKKTTTTTTEKKPRKIKWRMKRQKSKFSTECEHKRKSGVRKATENE